MNDGFYAANLRTILSTVTFPGNDSDNDTGGRATNVYTVLFTQSPSIFVLQKGDNE